MWASYAAGRSWGLRGTHRPLGKDDLSRRKEKLQLVDYLVGEESAALRPAGQGDNFPWQFRQPNLVDHADLGA